MLGWLGNIVGSVLGGGVTGILGVGIQRFFEYKNHRLDLELANNNNGHELAMKQADATIMANEWAQRTRIAEVEATGKESVADAQAFSASFNEPQRYSEAIQTNTAQGWLLVILDFIRGIIRPGLTVYLCVLTTLIYLESKNMQMKVGFTPEDAHEMVRLITSTVLYLTTTCTLYWFGTRNKQSAPRL